MLNFLFRELGGLAAMYNVATTGVPEPYKKPEACSAAMKDFISQYVCSQIPTSSTRKFANVV